MGQQMFNQMWEFLNIGVPMWIFLAIVAVIEVLRRRR